MDNNNNKNLPLYKQIAQDLLHKINTGVYKENELIPREVDLAEKYYKVSRPTVRKAIETLVDEGYLERKKRKGTTVKRRKIVSEFTQVVESYDEEMLRKGYEPKTIMLFFNKDRANEEISERLDIDEGDDVYKLIRLRYAAEKPVVLVTTYLPAKRLPKLDDIDFSKQKLYSVLAEKKMPVNRVMRILDIVKADETTADLLNIDVQEPIYYFRTVGYSRDDIPVEYSIAKYRSDITSFTFEISNSDHLRLRMKGH